tara:strand:- start:4777 stop:7620 length:2844 start_codon:yes stop_codon:yes gene_type:complete
MIQIYVNTVQTSTDFISGNILGNSNFANPVVNHRISTVLHPSYTGTYSMPTYDTFENALPVPGDWKSYAVMQPTNIPTVPLNVTGGQLIIEPPDTQPHVFGIYQLVFCEPNTTYDLSYNITQNTLLGFNSLIVRGQMLNNTPYIHNSTVNNNFLGNVYGFAENGTSQAGSTAPGIQTVTISQTLAGQNYAVFYMEFNVQATSVGQKLKIKDIRLTKQNAQIVTVDDEDYEQIDLYKNENIPLVFNVDNFTKATEKVANYSKNFTIPASKHNNKVFSHIFDVTVNSDFNVHRRTKAYITQNTSLIFEGYLRLLSIKKKGDEYMYEVNLFDNTISLKDTVKDRTLDDIDFTELEHQYRITEILQTMGSTSATPGQMDLDNPLGPNSFAGNVGATTTDVIQYPLCDWAGNVTYVGTQVSAARLEDMYRPWIKVSYIWNRIIDEAGFTWSSRYSFKTDDLWTLLYMDMNWGSGSDLSVGNFFNQSTLSMAGLGSSFNFSIHNTSLFANGKAFNLTQGSFVKIPLNQENPATSGWNGSTYEYTAPTDLSLDVTYEFSIFGFSADTCDFRIVHTSTATSIVSPFGQQTVTMPTSTTVGAKFVQTISGTFQMDINAGETFHFELKNGSFDDCFLMNDLISGQGYYSNINFANIIENATGATVNQVMLRNRGKIKQWEFIKSFIDRFNLVVELDKEDKNHLYFDYYYEWESSGKTHNWTQKVDATDIDIKPISTLKDNILFHDTLDEDFHNQAYFGQIGEINGQATFTDPENNLAEGEEKITTFFAPNINVKGSSLNIFNNAIFMHAFKENEDGTTTDFDSKPRLGYRDFRIVAPAQLKYLAQNGVSQTFTSSYLAMSPFDHTNSLNINFGHAFSFFGPYTTPTNNCVSKFWLQYLRNLYDRNTRIVVIKIYLTEVDLRQFEFSDTIMIKNRSYRVNKINYNPDNLSKVELILLP